MKLISLRLGLTWLFAASAFFLVTMPSCQKAEDFKFERGIKSSYKSEYRDTLNNLIFSEIIEIIGTGEKTHFSDRQEKIFYRFNYSSEDSARFVNDPRLYNEFTYSKSWQRTFSQGIIQNEERLWMHPLRANQYRFTQDSPFPEVRFPLAKGKQWQGGLRSGTQVYKNIYTDYEVLDRGTYKGQLGSIADCWFIHSSSDYQGIINELNMVYHMKRGFLLFDYKLHNGDHIKIEMIGENEAVTDLDYEKYEQLDARNR